MGRRGTGKPTALKVVDGLSKDDKSKQSRRTEPKPSSDFVKPAFEDQIASDKWDDVMHIMATVPGLVTIADVDELVMYCETWAEYRRKMDAGKWQASLIDRLIRFHDRFGMNPSARSGIDLKRTSINAKKSETEEKQDKYFGSVG